MWSARLIIVVMSLSFTALGSHAQIGGCDGIAGTFLVEGTQAEGEYTKSVYYLENINGGQSRREGHHFEARYDRNKQVLDTVMFNVAGAKLFEFAAASQYTCKGGVLVREYDVRGGGEGCSKEGHVRSQIDIGPSGELRYTTSEHWEFGLLCFAKARDVQRLSSFPRYEGRQ